MINCIRVRISAALLCLLLAAFTGCAGPNGERALPSPPSELIRSQLGTIAIVCDRIPELEMRKVKDRGGGMGQGALEGFGAGFEAGGHGGGNLGTLLIWTVSLPVGTIVGAIKGAGEGVPGEQIELADRELRAAVGSIDFSRQLSADLMEMAAKNTRHQFKTVSSAADSTLPPDRYLQLQSQGINTVMEVSVLSAGLAGPKLVNPDLEMLMRVRTRLVRVSDGTELYNYTWVKTAGSMKFTQWGADQARSFRDEARKSSRYLAESIVDELFLMYRPGPSTKPAASGENAGPS